MANLQSTNYPTLDVTIPDMPEDFTCPAVFQSNEGYWKMDQTADIVLEALVNRYSIPRGDLLDKVAGLHSDIRDAIRFELTAAFLAGADCALAGDLPDAVTVIAPADRQAPTAKQRADEHAASHMNPLQAMLAQLGITADTESPFPGIQVIRLPEELGSAEGEGSCGGEIESGFLDDDGHAINAMVAEGGPDTEAS